jgi:hypothetical protein
VGAGTEEDESSTGRVWAAGFHHVTALSRLARVLKLMNPLFNFPFFSGRGKPRVTESVAMGTRLYMKSRIISAKHKRYFVTEPAATSFGFVNLSCLQIVHAFEKEVLTL